MSEQRTPAFRAVCPACDAGVESDDPNELVAFHRRHHGVTGHDVAVERASLPVDEAALPEGGVTTVIDALGDDYPDGVPLGAVAAAMAERGRTVGETLDLVHEARMTGALYEPADDHLTAV